MTDTPATAAGSNAQPARLTYQCDGCKLVTESVELLQKTRRSFRRKPLRLCPPCQLNRYKHTQRVLWAMWVIFFMLGVVSYWRSGDVADLVEIVVLLLSVILLGLTSTFLHEMGHVAAAKAVGWNIHSFVMGMGRLVWQGRLRDTLLQVRFIQLGGMVFCTPSKITGWFHAQAAMVFLAGPLSNLLQVAMFSYLKAWARHNAGSEMTADILVNIAKMGMVLNGINALVNLWPTQYNMGGSMMGSDGYNLLQIFIRPLLFRERYKRGTPVSRYMTLRQMGEVDRAAAVAADAWRAWPDDPYIGNCYSAALLERGEYEKALPICEDGLRAIKNGYARSVLIPDQVRPQALSILEAVFKNNLAYAWLHMKVNLPKALELATEARNILPWEAGIQSTYGYALILNGNPTEGLALMRAAEKRSHDQPDHVRREIAEIIRQTEVGLVGRGD